VLTQSNVLVLELQRCCNALLNPRVDVRDGSLLVGDREPLVVDTQSRLLHLGEHLLRRHETGDDLHQLNRTNVDGRRLTLPD
jgi:hypothetical protein